MPTLERLTLFLKQQSKGTIFIQALALVAAIGFLDYVTGYEVTFFPFYSIPILLAVWFGDLRLSLVISLCSALAWWGADTASGHVYSRGWFQIWDTIVRLMFFCLVMAVGALFKQQRDASRARVALLERLHALEEEIIDISEQERRRIGRDLHDGVCQHLAAIGFTAGLLKRELASVSPPHSKLARDVADRLNETLVITRDLSRGLCPVTAEERGLESALHDLACTSAQLTGISCQFVCPDPVLLDDTEVSVHLFRIAQEALNNATKHSSATEIIISLANTGSELVLAVSDNGTGLSDSSANEKGIGLKIMAYRARCIGSALTIRENIPHGTVVSCTLPHSTLPFPATEMSEYE